MFAIATVAAAVTGAAGAPAALARRVSVARWCLLRQKTRRRDSEKEKEKERSAMIIAAVPGTATAMRIITSTWQQRVEFPRYIGTLQ